MTLKSRSAVVTGSTSGIGLGYARALAKEGVNVMINGFGEKPPRSRRSALGSRRISASRRSTRRADMTKPDEIAEMVADRARRPSARSTSSSTMPASSTWRRSRSFRIEKWDAIIAINLSSAFHAIRAAVPGMKERNWGRIINTASAHSLVASPFKSAYVSAKHGIAGLTKTVALEARDLRHHRATASARAMSGRRWSRSRSPTP